MGLLKWRDNKDQLKTILEDFRKVDGDEVVKVGARSLGHVILMVIESMSLGSLCYGILRLEVIWVIGSCESEG